jgi:DNA-binding MarR family transcriptional regulator
MSNKKAQSTSSARLAKVADAVHSSSLRLLRLLRLQDKASGIGPAQLSALSVLVFGGSCSLKQLAAIEQVKPPTMSRVVAGLERAGFVRRHTSSEDRRRIVLSATAAGLRVIQAGRERRVEFLAKRLAGLKAHELTTLAIAARVIFRVLRNTS